MRKVIMLILTVIVILLFGCGKNGGNAMGYQKITPQQAKEIIDSNKEAIILDVRTNEEFAQGHIEGAVLIPDTEVAEKAESILPDKNATILVYCRSGRRSELSAKKLVEMGYTDVKDFGGILDWPYDLL